MTASRKGRRRGTARELAQKYGVSERTIRNDMAEPRETYEARAAARHERIRQLREQGLSMRAIAATEGITVGAVHYALHKNAA